MEPIKDQVKLPKPDERVFITGLYAGMFSQHVCCVEDATNAEILAKVNEQDPIPGGWDVVMRTEEDAERAGTNFAAPGPCKECPGRIHLVIRKSKTSEN